MNFGSKFVYDYNNSEDECVSDDEFEDGMALDTNTVGVTASDIGNSNDEDEGSASVEPPVPPPPPPRRARSGLFRRVFGGSLQEGDATTTQVPKLKKKKKHHWENFRSSAQARVKGRKWRRADTNVMTVKFDELCSPSNMHTGDAVYCEQCKAVLSHISKVEQLNDQQIWRCEFCRHGNEVDLIDEEIPRKEDVTFMLSPAPSTTASTKAGTDQSLVIFCIDTSGSMCVTTEVKGKLAMRGDRLSHLQTLNDTGESQYLPGQHKNVTFVSRLQGLQAAVDHQLEQLAEEHASRRVALVTFSSEVTVIGDGTSEPVHFSGDKLSNRAELIKAGAELPMPQAIKASRRRLGDKVFNFEEGGQTALGPALLLSVAMASQATGSKVIMCTDGLANVGLGNLDVDAEDVKYKDASDFYDQVSSMAADNGVSISVTSIKGTDCKMRELGKIADGTGGQVNIVDPLKLTEEFGNILADTVIATNVEATLLVHSMLYIRNESQQVSRSVRNVGNVTNKSEVTFEFGKKFVDKPKKRKEKAKATEADAEPVYDNNDEMTPTYDNAQCSTAGASAMEIDLKELPFQLQVSYTDLEGARAMRLITRNMPITHERDVAEKHMNKSAVTVVAAQQSARMALEGEYSHSRLNAFMYQRLLARRRDADRQQGVMDDPMYDMYLENVGGMEQQLNKVQKKERVRYGYTHSDEEDSDEDEYVPRYLPTRGSRVQRLSAAPQAPAGSQRHSNERLRPLPLGKAKSRSAECDDETATDLYANAKMSSHHLASKSKR